MTATDERQAVADFAELGGWHRRNVDRTDYYTKGGARVQVIWQARPRSAAARSTTTTASLRTRGNWAGPGLAETLISGAPPSPRPGCPPQAPAGYWSPGRRWSG